MPSVLFFFVVKAVLGSGSSAWASSNGFYIDISPPEFDTQVMFYVDVSQGEDLPAELQAQGSNDTIKAVWLCEDKQSEIAVGCLHFEIDLHDRYVYVDVSQGEDLPAELQAQGSNDTIKAVWLCEDKQSEIAVGCLHFEIDLHDRYVYVDVSQVEDLPAELQAQGSNDTIKVVWLCEDKQSEIAVGCLHFEIDLHDRYVLCRCESGRGSSCRATSSGI